VIALVRALTKSGLPRSNRARWDQHLFSADFQSHYLRLHYSEVVVRLVRAADLAPRVVKGLHARGERRVVALIEDGRSDALVVVRLHHVPVCRGRASGRT
jgi:hypothetical protein